MVRINCACSMRDIVQQSRHIATCECDWVHMPHTEAQQTTHQQLRAELRKHGLPVSARKVPQLHSGLFLALAEYHTLAHNSCHPVGPCQAGFKYGAPEAGRQACSNAYAAKMEQASRQHRSTMESPPQVCRASIVVQCCTLLHGE